MHVVWKRPDGFLGAEPKDFYVVDVAGKSRLWLHKSDDKWYPFRIAGGWQEEEATQRLNSLINLIGKPMSHWSKIMVTHWQHSMTDDPQKYFDETMQWLQSLSKVLKGDTWELEIMSHSLEEITTRLKDAKTAYMSQAK
jgi:hypothetical protein